MDMRSGWQLVRAFPPRQPEVKWLIKGESSQLLWNRENISIRKYPTLMTCKRKPYPYDGN